MSLDLNGKTVALTGRFTLMTRKQAAEALIQRGARVSSKITPSVSVLFVGEKAGSKVSKAKSLSIPVHTEATLNALLGQAPAAPSPSTTLADGEVAYVQGSAAKPYTLKNIGGVYSCSCPAWRNQSRPIDRRTCKHLKAFRGAAVELARVGMPHTATPKGAASTKTSADPGVMLAQRWDPAQDVTGWWMSEKLDGVRAYWDGKALVSRLGNRFHAPQWFLDGLPSTPLDGELWIERGAFQRTVSIVRRQSGGDRWRAVRYLVFDAPEHDGTFEERIAWLRANVQAPCAAVVAHTPVRGLAHLRQELQRIEALSGEGVMLRRPCSPYVRGRSSALLKVKSFFDAEARVLNYSPGAGRHSGRVGALQVISPDGVAFKVGTGLTDQERDNPPAIGSVITYRYQELTDAGVPRFPSYIGIRDDYTWPAGAAAGNTDVSIQLRRKKDGAWTIQIAGSSAQTVATMRQAIQQIADRSCA
jgi:DNA ligase-1